MREPGAGAEVNTARETALAAAAAWRQRQGRNLSKRNESPKTTDPSHAVGYSEWARGLGPDSQRAKKNRSRQLTPEPLWRTPGHSTPRPLAELPRDTGPEFLARYLVCSPESEADRGAITPAVQASTPDHGHRIHWKNSVHIVFRNGIWSAVTGSDVHSRGKVPN